MDRNALAPIFLLTLAAIFFGRNCLGDGHAHKLGDKKDIKDTEHMQKHLDEEGVKANATEMSEDEQIFYYFKLHDYDNSSTIDGLEIYHAHLHRKSEDEKLELTQKFKDEVAGEVDVAMKKFDTNNDGQLNYVEYKIAFNSPEN